MRSNDFDDIFNECIERLLNGETIEQCLQSHLEHAVELEPMLRTAETIGKVSAISPRPEFKARARYEFHSALSNLEIKEKRRFSLRPHWSTALVALILVFLFGGSTVAAAEKSMPDGPLYPVKLATEEARLVLTRSDERKAELYAEMAERRISEMAYVASKGKSEHVEIVARRLNSHLGKVVVLATGVVKTPKPVMEGGPAALSVPAPAPRTPLSKPPTPRSTPVPSGQTATPEQGITKVAPRQNEVISGAQAAQANENRKKTVDSVKAKKYSILKETIKRQAINNPERLRELLKTAPESVKPALKRAIALSEQAYQSTLGSIEDDED
ncbi:MAG: hypothetical protein HYX79_08265 [Chloroflexi bacterium]|nr:hypothetical protein [Chloroflexota bacterium]